MIRFRRKIFTIQEGHYTGPKDMDKVPGAVEIIGKSAVGGAIVGGIIGKVANSETIEGAITGGKWGALGGVLLKLFINYLHNPMTSVKFNEVDKNIRREFGVIRAAGVTVGDSVDRRASIDEKFSFNDRNVTAYKINFAVADNKVTMYTYGVTKEELDKLNKILDYYCKKYFGMEYTAGLINQKLNSYYVGIVFTNYQVISNFIMEISNELQTKINLLDNKAIVSGRLQDAANEEEEKTYSVKEINKYDLIKILGKSSPVAISGLKADWKTSISYALLGLITSSLGKLNQDELVKNGLPATRESFGNSYLEDTLKKLHYVEGFNYTIRDKSATDNFSMASGRFIVTSTGDNVQKIDSVFWSPLKAKVNRSETGKVVVYTYTIQSRAEFEFILKKLMSTKITFNIFEK